MKADRGRTVRVCLSSTFRDFGGARDLRVRRVFPELRRKCRERQVTLVDVDLRWGITEEEAQQGKVLRICLAEIERARPFLLGFLGERFGGCRTGPGTTGRRCGSSRGWWTTGGAGT